MNKILSTALAITLLSPGLAAAAEQCDTTRGQRVFANTCQICHSVESGDHLVGPSLQGIMGRTVGNMKGFAYSSDLAAAKGKWDAHRLDQFLESPQQMFPGTAMAFAGLRNEQDRNAVACFLETKSTSAPKSTSAKAPRENAAFEDIRKRLREVERLWVARNAMGVSRLLYADDVLILGQGEKEMVGGRVAVDNLVKTLVEGAATVEIKLVDGRTQGKDGVVTWIRWHVVPTSPSEKPFDVMSLYAWRHEPVGWRVVSDMYALQ